MFKFSKKSLDALETVEMELRVLMKKALETSRIDFAITEGYRTIERQQELFKRGRDGKGGKRVTYKDGIYKRSKHQDGKAIDFIPFVNGKYRWDNMEAYIYLVSHILETAHKLGIRARSGSTWNIKDWPHIELY